MFQKIVNNAFDQFDREALTVDERIILDGGVKKHLSILYVTTLFVLPQLLFASFAENIMLPMTAASFIAMMLGTAWYAISFQNVSAPQLDAGVADYITKKMFRGFVLSFQMLITCVLVFMTKEMFPEIESPSFSELPLTLRIPLYLVNVAWMLLLLADVILASIAYDGADSLLGDGFPTLMRGASANHNNREMTLLLSAMAQNQGIDIKAILNKKPEAQVEEGQDTNPTNEEHEGK